MRSLKAILTALLIVPALLTGCSDKDSDITDVKVHTGTGDITVTGANDYKHKLRKV